MSELKGTVVASPIVPYSSEDTFATHYAKYGKGGFMSVSTISDRDAIPEARREEGMFVFVVNDPSGISSYQYLGGKWVKSAITNGSIERVQTLAERDSRTTDFTVGTLVFVEEGNGFYFKQSNSEWVKLLTDLDDISGIPTFNHKQIEALSREGRLPNDYISVPSPSELSAYTDTNTYTTSGNGYYLDVIFSTMRKLQAEIARIKNTFNYGIYSYTDKDTAMSRVMANKTKVAESEPLWAIEETDLSTIEGVWLDLTDSNSLEPSTYASFVRSDGTHLVVTGSAKWVDKDSGFISTQDSKIFLYTITSETKLSVTLLSLDEVNRTLELNLENLGLRQYVDGRYKIMLCISRETVDKNTAERYGSNFIWLSVGNYVTGEIEDQGYWNLETNRLQKGVYNISDRYTISSVEFRDLNVYKFDGYSKYQDFSRTVMPSTPSDEDYKYRVAHITIRSVKNIVDLEEIKDQLPTNELIYNEETSGLWIKTSNGTVKQISGGSEQESDSGMTKAEILQWLSENGIVITNGESIKMNNVADITFIHQETGKAFRFSADSEGNLVKKEIPEVTLEDRMSAAEFEVSGNNITSFRGFVGNLGFKELSKLDPANPPKEKGDIRLYSDRIKIGALYAPYSSDQPAFGCSHAFIELENTSETDFPLDGCYLHYATGTSGAESTDQDDITVYHLALDGKIPAGGTYLIRGKQYSSFDSADCFIKVKTFDKEWYVEDLEGNLELIDLTQNKNNTFLLTYGLPEVTYSTNLVVSNSENDANYGGKAPYFYHPNYIDSVSVNNPVTSGGSTGKFWMGAKVVSFNANCNITNGTKKYDAIYKNTFELDPAKQAYQALTEYDSSRHRGKNVTDFQYVLLDKEYIEFPKTDEKYPVSRFTPKASWEHKNVCTDKSKLDMDKPNVVSVSFGIDMYKTRCFNWVSAGYFREFVWIRRKGQETWESRFESYNGVDESDKPGTMTKKTFGDFYNNTTGQEEPLKSVIYDRLTGIFPADGTKYTAHRCIVDIVSTKLTSGKQEYEYVVGRADKNMEPDADHTSDIQTFTLYSDDYTPRIFQITDQQGFHWVEYQCWAAAAEEINKTITEISQEENIIPVLINTGDVTQNGTRVNEWLDYYNAGKCLFNHLEQMNVVGNNDLCGTDPEILGTGDDDGKSNSFYFHVFNCYEIDPSVLPIISNINTTKYIPSFYYFQNDSYRFINLNTEITEVNCRSWFKQTKRIASGKECTVNIYTGWTVQPSGATAADVPEYDSSFKTIYTMLYDILNSASGRDIIVSCHEMPFTVITDSNLDAGKSTVDRSLNGSATGALVGCHNNRLGYADTAGIYWLSRLLENFHIKLMLGGHKHTYACTNPLREFYLYDNETKNSLTDGPMTMERTLENDSAVWSSTLKLDGGTYTISGSGEDLAINTTKYPIMLSETSGVTKSGSKTYPFYGASSSEFNRGTGVVYFMCQATGFKLKSNKELPSPDQRFSYVIPKTNISDPANNKPNGNQQRPMFAEVKLNGNNSYSIYLYRIENIMDGTNLYSQWQYSNSPASYKYLQGNVDGGDGVLYGSWVTNKTPLIEI